MKDDITEVDLRLWKPLKGHFSAPTVIILQESLLILYCLDFLYRPTVINADIERAYLRYWLILQYGRMAGS